MLFGDEHVQRYVATDGEEGYHWQGTTILILTTTGRRTGEQRSKPLIYREHDGQYLVVASKGGSDAPPAWFLNLQANPVVTVQVRGDVFAARGRPATPQEKPDFWRKMTEVWPPYDDYQRKTERQIPVVVLERT